MYYDETWLLHNVELVHLFGGAGGSDCNVPLSRLVVGHGCIYDWNFHFLNITEPTRFMHMLLLYFSCLGYSNDICSLFPTNIYWTLSIYVYMNVILMFHWLDHHFGSLPNLISIF